jgi:hypothetical protein
MTSPTKTAPAAEFHEQDREINLMLEHAVNVANMMSETTSYDIIAKPKKGAAEAW